jgi:hypothetical protein
MLMTTRRLIVLRLFNVTLGRFGWGARLLRRLLVRKLITRSSGPRYMASSRFFDFSELDGHQNTSASQRQGESSAGSGTR